MKKLINLANFTQTIDKFNEGKESLEDFWKGNHEALLHNLISKENIHELYNGLSSKALVDWYKKEFEIAKSLNIRYMVMHIADMDIHDIYTGDYRYTDEDSR